MKYLFFTFFLLTTFSFISFAQKYEANWESLDQRPVADWFSDAKFGIFIHWGPYSVPAFSPKGTYSEWYQYWLKNESIWGNGTYTGKEIPDFHKKTYGEDFSYYDFGNLFKAELFDPDQWADIFKKAGAKYIVITSKHHDGYTLWPNEQANDRGFKWNSVDVGSGRDLLGELTKSVKETGIKMGMYYSLYEWYHPWYINDKDKFVDEHFFPQFKDLVESYEPDIVWTDGEWEMEAEKWKTPELLAWLFNESKVKDEVVINDRWGKGIRHKHGGYFTTEYGEGLGNDHAWEECRGMGFSFGYNRNEREADYNSPQTLILTLVDVVSRGGNLLLDIGPDGDGSIPVIMEQRLLEMGKWLETNGSAIYGTESWKEPIQWTEGERDYKKFHEKAYIGGELILKQTVDSPEGYASKEVFFTYSPKQKVLHAILPKWPGNTLKLKNINLSKENEVKLLATGKSLSFKNNGKDCIINMPEFNPNDFKLSDYYAFVLSITNVEK